MKEIMTNDDCMLNNWQCIDRFDAGCGFVDVFAIPDENVEAETETIETQTVKKDLYKWSSSSQAPWEINEGKPHVAFLRTIFGFYCACQ